MFAVRRALGQKGRGDKKTDPPPAPASDADLAAAQARLRPMAATMVGLAGVAVLVWLMELKPV